MLCIKRFSCSSNFILFLTPCRSTGTFGGTFRSVLQRRNFSGLPLSALQSARANKY
ncbi:hypothetical protein RSAG8_01013, partial [Rhizoctonia solani AG-8 WAC10335]